MQEEENVYRRKRQKNGMINKEKENIIDSAEPENNSMTQKTQTPQQTVDAQQMVIPQESERIQRAEWIHEQVKLQREAEDEAWGEDHGGAEAAYRAQTLHRC